MFLFLIPLLVGFAFNWASAFTHFYSRRWGESSGRGTTFILRNILGIPIWALGIVLAMRESALSLFTPGLVVIKPQDDFPDLRPVGQKAVQCALPKAIER